MYRNITTWRGVNHSRLHHSPLRQSLLAERPRYLSIARRILGDATDAEDVVQSLWLKLLAFDERTPVRDAGAFLSRLIRNLALDQHRHIRVRRDAGAGMPDVNVIVDERPGAEQMMIDRERLSMLRAAIDELPPRCREIFELRRIHDLDSATIAKRLGITQNAVAKHIRHALQHCRACLTREGGA